MWFEPNRSVPAMREQPTTARRGLVAGSALTLLLAGSLVFATPTVAQDETDTDTDVAAEATVTVDESAGTTVEAGTTGEAAAGTDATAVAAAAPAAPAAGAAGATAPTALPNTGVGEPAPAPLALIGLAAAGAVAAGAVSVNQLRPAGRRA